MKEEFFTVTIDTRQHKITDPPRYVEFTEIDSKGNILSVERFHGKGVIEKIK